MSIRPERAKGKRLLGLMPLPSQEPVEWIRPYSQGEKGVAMEKQMTHQDYVDGYMDGRDKGTPEPNDNRSERYKHSFNVGRAEIDGFPIPYDVSMSHVIVVEEVEENR